MQATLKMVLAVLVAGAGPALGAGGPLKLGAPPPAECAPERRFDFWIGEWDVVQRHLRDGAWVEVPGSELIVEPVLGGNALIEHFRGPNGLGRDLLGFSLRAHDPVKDAWVVLLRWPSGDGGGRFWTMEGGFHHNRCEISTPPFANAAGETVVMRFTFSDAIDGYYRWNDGSRSDGGETWATRFIMEGVRRDPGVVGRLDRERIHARGEPELSSEPDHRALDPLLGEYQGVTEAGEFRLTVEPILGGSAQLVRSRRVSPDGAEHEAIVVQGYDVAAGTWVAWHLDQSRRFGLLFGERSGDGFVFTQRLGAGDDRDPERVTWRPGPDGTLR